VPEIRKLQPPANEPGIDLCRTPMYRLEDAGKAVPPSAHAVSVAMPLWAHVVGYEENDPAVVAMMTTGYPRFLFHRYVVKLFESCEAKFAGPGESCFAFPSMLVAQRCAEFIQVRSGTRARVDDYGSHGIAVVTIPKEQREHAQAYWQHFGQVISSRFAKAVLEGAPQCNDESDAAQTLRQRLAGYVGQASQDVYLYPSGMAAMAAALRVLRSRSEGCKTVQLGIPYVDGLKVQDTIGPGVHFVAAIGQGDVDRVRSIVDAEQLAGLFCEVPGNPLLQTPDLAAISALLRPRGIPLVVDETLSSFTNVELSAYADMVVTSLTKYVSGVGDVMGGSLILNARSPLYADLEAHLRSTAEQMLWWEDAEVLERNSRDFPDRMQRINQGAERVCDALRKHPCIARLYYPKYESAERFERIRTANGGYGGLFSMLLHHPEATAQPFYDALELTKGPNLGTNFTLVCPYTLLAHYKELDWVETLGVSRYLIRVSIGLEEPEDLITKFQSALDAVAPLVK
jgi:cystathionine gamma-synthase